jgi:hypothetical protein
MSNKSANLLQSKPVKEMHSGKKLSTTNSSSLNSNITSVQRVTQKRRYIDKNYFISIFFWLFSYYRSATAWRSAKLKYRRELSIVTLMKTSDLSSNYHPWESEYNKIIIREKKIKSMTKDPYTPFSRLISQAVENLTTESECYPILIPAKDVQIQTFNIQNMSIPPKPLRNFLLSFFLQNYHSNFFSTNHGPLRTTSRTNAISTAYNRTNSNENFIRISITN